MVQQVVRPTYVASIAGAPRPAIEKADLTMADVHVLPTTRPNWEWQQDAACRGGDVSTFYHPDNERGVSRARREMRAKAICATCPVKANCLAWALSTREPYGIWGGLSVEEREQRITRMGQSAQVPPSSRSAVSA
jgi:WhiB family transcriptional regulator, redox-sensing transcriptional regulator